MLRINAYVILMIIFDLLKGRMRIKFITLNAKYMILRRINTSFINSVGNVL